MDGRGGCCIARYADGAYDMSKVNRIMLRFRPIAPKPATGSSVCPPENTYLFCSKSGRGKRKIANSNNRRCNRKRKSLLGEENRDATRVTLPLLPESPDRKDRFPVENVASRNVPMWLCFGNNNNNNSNSEAGNILMDQDRTVVMPQAVKAVGSCVTVESVTDTWVDGDELGSTDEERRVNLERDTCPGFISDCYGSVTWTNEAYRNMVGEDNKRMVWLEMKEKVPVTRTTHPAFTCRVRLQYTCGKERSSLILPCDVWRMLCGGFAWRLDVKAALCLG
ncbi:hypothetical protein CFOL_v3_11748, partial [Cephalotus follicularis]